MSVRRRLCTSAVAAVISTLGVTAGAHAQTAPPGCTAGTQVQTKAGPVCGTSANGQTDYLDIPYAAPPVGALRFAPPAPAHHWTRVYPATQRPAMCPQPSFPSGGLAPGTSENCLYLEVQEPAGVKPGAHLPVMVEIHGGGFLGEYRDDDGTNLINSGPAIYVYVEYRLGILGFLADRAFGGHAGDYGLQDQQAGLRWIKQNISAFGGDPHRVTLFGESAGGASVCDQVASPTARGLFQRGISVSGFYNFNVNTIWWPADCKSKLQTEAQAQQAGRAFAAKVGCAKATQAAVAACLRAAPVATLVQAAGSYESPGAGGSIGPIVNGSTLTMPAAKAFRTGHVNPVKLILGVGRDEFNGGVYTNQLHTVIATTPAQYTQLVTQQFGTAARRVLALYPLTHFPSPSSFIADRTVMADAFSVCPALQADARLSRYIPVYAYEDDDADSPSTGETLPLGAYHSAINRLVHDLPSSLDPNQAALQSEVLSQWTGFARDGNPNAPYTAPWTRYSAAHPAVMSLQPAGDSTLVPTSTLRLEHHCAFWDAINRTAPWAVH